MTAPSSKKNLSRLLARVRHQRTVVAASAITIGLFITAIFAMSDLWRTEVPSVRAVGARAPISVVVSPVLYRRHHAATTSRQRHAQAAGKHKTQALAAGIRKRASVQLTAKQTMFVKKLGQYLNAQGQTAVVTSGKRTPDHQLNIIKSKVRSLGAVGKFPELRRAKVTKPSTWIRAWQWLRSRHVPVNAPAEAPGEYVETSNHLKGLAVDLISGSLDHLSSMVAAFAHSPFAHASPLRVTTIAREAGCVHVNLASK